MLHRLRRRLTYANIVSSLALFLVLTGGTAVALTGSNTVFTDDITNGHVRNADIGGNAVGGGKVADNSLSGADVNESTFAQVPSAANAGNAGTLDGKDSTEFLSSTGKAADADKLDGLEPSQLPGGVTSITPINNFPGIPFDLGTSTAGFKFVGNPETGITTTASQKLVGTASVPLADPTATSFDYDLCYRPSGGGALTPFSTSQSGATLTSTDVVYTAASSKVPGAGTWDVGFCLKQATNDARDAERTNEVNGWVMVVNP
jgi:hypothetical protein